MQTVVLDSGAEKMWRNDLRKRVADAGKKSVPEGAAKSGVYDERKDGHACQTSRDGNELATYREQTTNESGSFASLEEVVFGLLEFVAVEQKQFAPTAIDKSIDDFAAKEPREVIIDERTDKGSQCGAKNDDKEIESASGSIVGSRSDDEFGRKRNNRVFENHEKSEYPITEAIGVPLDKR